MSRRRNNRLQARNIWTGQYPRWQNFRLQYHETENVVGVASSYATFRCISLYDPQYAVGGGQPAGFDKLAEVYSLFYTWKTRIDVWVLSEDHAAVNDGISLIIVPCNYSQRAAVTALTATENMRLPGMKHRYITNIDGGQRAIHLSKTILTKNWCDGQFFALRAQGQITHGAAADPPQTPYFIVQIATTSGLTDMDVRIKYRLTFWGRAFRPTILPDDE